LSLQSGLYPRVNQWTVGDPSHPGLIGRRILLGAASSDQ